MASPQNFVHMSMELIKDSLTGAPIITQSLSISATTVTWKTTQQNDGNFGIPIPYNFAILYIYAVMTIAIAFCGRLQCGVLSGAFDSCARRFCCGRRRYLLRPTPRGSCVAASSAMRASDRVRVITSSTRL